jgi:hypothetical protein
MNQSRPNLAKDALSVSWSLYISSRHYCMPFQSPQYSPYRLYRNDIFLKRSSRLLIPIIFLCLFLDLFSIFHSSTMVAPTSQLPPSTTTTKATGTVAKWDSRYAGHVPHDTTYYAKCLVGGILACGLTHTAICPLDVTKCNMQVCCLLL